MAFPQIPTGIDMSHYQRLVDINQTSHDTVLWSTKATEGKRFVDRTFAASWAAFHAAPWIRYRGAYHWIRPDSDITVQAKHFLKMSDPCDPATSCSSTGSARTWSTRRPRRRSRCAG